MSQLLAQADAAMVEFSRIVATYRVSSAGLSADANLLAHVNRVLKPRKGVKPTSSVDIPVEEYCALLREGRGRYSAARALDLDPRDVKRRLQFDESFRDSVLMAEEEASEKVEEKLWDLANVDGEKWAMELWLKRRYKDRWGDEASVLRIEGSVKHEIGTGSILEQIAAIQSVLQNRAALTTGHDDNIIDAEVLEDE